MQAISKAELSYSAPERVGRAPSGDYSVADGKPAGMSGADAKGAETKGADGKIADGRGTKVRAMLRKQLGEDIYASWFKALEFDDFDGKTVKASVPVVFLRKWIQSHYMDELLTCCRAEFKTAQEVVVSVRQPGANANPYVAVIMLTGHSEKNRVTAARDAGITEFLAKPISAKGLYERIVNVVANPRPFIKTKTYFGPDRRRNVNPTYSGQERRKGGKADVIRQVPLLDKVRSIG